VHVVTVNDYLARRDSEWVGQVHKFLGLEVGLVQQVGGWLGGWLAGWWVLVWVCCGSVWERGQGESKGE
jgi:hypothetical protein